METEPTPENQHALALAYLLTGEVDRSILALEHLVQSAHDPDVLNDLAAAYFVRSRRNQSAPDAARGLELSDTVLARSPRSSAASFNRALALEALGNRPAALRSWRHYREIDPASPWTAEALEHIHQLSLPAAAASWDALRVRLSERDAADAQGIAKIAIRFPLRCRRTIEDDLLPKWAQAHLAGNAHQASRILHIIELVGAAIEARYREPTIADISRAIAKATKEGDSSRSVSLAHGYLAYARGRAAIGNDTAAARTAFRDAQAHFAAAGSPSMYAAGMFAVLQDYERRDYASALRLIESMKARPNFAHYAALAGQVLWMEGMVLLASGHPHQSLQRYRDALASFERSGEVESAAAVEGLIAENLQVLGDDDEAWTCRLKALPVVLQYGDARRQQVAFNEAAEAALQQGLLSAALEYQTSSVALAEGGSDDSMAAYAYIGRALILDRKNRSSEAAADVERARTCALRIKDASIRENTTADVDMADAFVHQRLSASKSVAKATQALDYQTSGGYDFRSAQLLLARGRAQQKLGDIQRAEADFRGAIEAVESQRNRVSDPRLRSAFFGRAEDAYEELIALLVREHRTEDARAVFDRSCERTLTEIVGETYAASSEASAADPDEGTAVIRMAVLPFEIAAWVTRKSEASFSRFSIETTRVESMISAYERAIESNSADVPVLQASLYDALIRPLKLAPSDRTLMFITDAMLRRVPMASLLDRERDRFLIEDFAIATAPSAAVYRYCKANVATDLRSAPVTAIGNANAGLLTLGLENLPDAQAELIKVARHTRGRLLLNDAATPDSLLAAAASAGIVHYAGHALLVEKDRGKSALVLSPANSAPSSAFLYANRIAQSRLRAQLVVLSACTTNATARPAGGAIDVARAFLVAGVPTVVASRWPVTDGSARELLTVFMRELNEKPISPAEALQRAQIELLRDGASRRPVKAWCAFEVLGAV